MSAAVIDTNVAVVANGGAPQASNDCQLSCIDVLEGLVSSGVVVIDDKDFIMNEYQGRLSFAGQPGVGDAFFKYLFENQYNIAKVEQAPITPLNNDLRLFNEFPDDDRLVIFDPDDHKFVAAARASQHSPPIINAIDSDWSPVTEVLASWGIAVQQLCPDELKEI